MKTIFVSLLCLLAVSAIRVNQLNKDKSSQLDYPKLRQCLNNYNVDTVALHLENETNILTMYTKLNEVQGGCLTGCLFKIFNLEKPDGTFDLDKLVAYELIDNTEEDDKTFTTAVTECKVEAKNNECEYHACIQGKI